MLTAGSRLGSYEIIAPLGAGGMGDVYRARDPRLDREVAIKVLSTRLAGDPAALARFEREAMSVAKLSHPNILAIHEFGRDGGDAFVVMELVDGQTVRARLESGALPVRRAVGYGLQVVRGIAAAHARGIVHRDLKPENVMITRDDQIKILDFGLAKSVDPGDADKTIGGSAATSAGIVMGTIGYMAPEQVRGLTVDHRADLFAFGALLYEMLSGRRAFQGETAADTMTAILTKEPPDLETAALAIPPALDRIVRRCLEKQPELRFQSAMDLAFALETLSTGSTAAPAVEAVAPRTAGTSWLPWTAAAIGLAIAGASWLLPRQTAVPERAWSTFTRITESGGEETAPTLSPDGSTVAYAVRINGQWDIYGQRVGGRNATPLVNDPERHEGGPAFSPDGSLIAFHESDAGGGIFVAGATGESVRRLTDAGFDPAWSPDGQQIAFTTEEVEEPASRVGDSALFVVSAGGGTPRRLVEGDAVQASWSPSGQRLVYWSNRGGQRDIFTVAAAGGAPARVTDDAPLDWSPVWSPDGRSIYFSSDRGGAMNLWRIGIDEASGAPQGVPEAVTSGVQAAAGQPRFSRDGARLVFRSRVSAVNPVAIPFDPIALRAGTPTVLDSRNGVLIPNDVSSDGRLITYFNIGERQEDILIGTPNGPIRRIIDDPPRDRAAMFTPDGRSLVFYSNRDGTWSVWVIGVDGSNLRKLTIPEAGAIYPIMSPKGDAVVFTSDNAALGVYVAPFGVSGGLAPTRLPGTTVDGLHLTVTDWSPDGSRLTGYVISDSGHESGVGVYDLTAKQLTLVATDETSSPLWLADSRRLVYFARGGADLIVLDPQTRVRTVIDVRLPGPSVNDLFAISPDNRMIYYGAARAEADIWIAERK